MSDRRKNPTYWSIKEKERALDLYRTGVPPSEIERMTGIPKTTIQDWRKKAGIPADRKARATPRATREFKMLVNKLYDEGKSAAEIGELLGKAESTIDYYLINCGIRRSRSEALRIQWANGRRTASKRTAVAA